MELDFNQGNISYLIDTSGLIYLEYTFKYDNPVFRAIWEEIEDLIQLGSFKTIDFVEDEVNSYQGKEDFLKKWVKKWKRLLIVETDVASINASRPIINEEYQSGFFNASKLAEGREEADPFLIGYCIVHKYVLITNESRAKPNKIPAIATKNGVKCIDINGFMSERGLRMERKKK